MHTILHLQADGLHARSDETLKQRLHKTRPSGFLAHDHWSQLAVITDKHDLLRSEDDGNETFWFSRLGALVDKYFLKAARS
jgi:hypothetical protein